jgi:imidazolonepropionase-like amidohydrolase
MNATRTLGALLLAACVGATALTAQALVIRGGTVHTLAGETIEGGTVVIEHGLITAVGDAVSIPAGVEVLDATGMHVYPGLFDGASNLGLTEVGSVDVTNDMNELGDFNPHLLAMTAVHPASEHIPVARANGVTHTVAMPGARAGGIGGQGSLLHLDGWTVEEMAIEPSVGFALTWPSLGRGRSRGFGGATPQSSFSDAKKQYDERVAAIAAKLDSAQHYASAAAAGNAQRDLRLEALAKAVSGELPLLVSANAEREISDAIDFGESHGVRIVIMGGRFAWKVADRLAEKSVPVILGPTQALPSGEDLGYDQVYAQPGQLFAAGVKVGFGTFGASASRNLPYEVGNAVSYGLPHDEAVMAVTINTAEILGVGDKLGTIESGKIANLIVTGGDPLEYQTPIHHVIIAGRVSDMMNKHLELYERYRARPER